VTAPTATSAAGPTEASNTTTAAAATTTPITDASPPTTAPAAPDGLGGDAATDDGASDPGDDGPPVNTAPDGLRLLDFAFEEVPSGDYRVETIGAPFTIDMPAGWSVQPNFGAHFVLSAPDSGGPGDRDIVMIRPSHLADPDQPNAPLDDQRGDWPLDDIEGWLAALPAGIVTGEPERTTVGGLEAARFDVSLTDEIGCGTDFCVGFATNRDVHGIAFDRRIGYRLWWIDGGEHSPVVVVVGDGTDESFTSRAEAVLDTVVFESIGPNPIPAEADLWELGYSAVAPAGTVRLPVGPGVEFELSEDRFVDQYRQFAHVLLGDEPPGPPGQTDIIFPDQDVEGGPVTDLDGVIAALALHGLESEVVGTRLVSGYDTTILDIRNPAITEGRFTGSPVFRSSLDPYGTWEAPPRGTLWVIDAPTGLAIVTAEAIDFSVEDDARAQAEEIVDSLVIDP